jgi:tetrahydromethanopterin S-methyltransferase subunit G
MAHLEGAYDQINERLGSLDRRLDGVDRRLDNIDQRFNWLFGLVASTWLTTIAAILPLYFKH